ncbi:hemicentin-1-like [Watersipora subatra]|uniref:hemicentin-1-like n=1 Tax=Watersipora subatra TaxID=2589382 RepID=UPI00355C6A77
MQYHESTCTENGQRSICLSWSQFPGCEALTEDDGIRICGMNHSPLMIPTGDGQILCDTVNAGAIYSLGVASQRPMSADSFNQSITLRGYPNGGVNCEAPVSHCAVSESNDFRISIQVSSCPQSGASVECVCPEWSNWSSCSVTCGDGAVRTRARGSCSSTCSLPTPLSESSLCPGTQTSCPVDGQYSEWTVWTTCPVTCNTGTQTRGRMCSMPAPAFGGQDCVGSSIQTRFCILDDCPQLPKTRLGECKRKAKRGTCRHLKKRARKRCIKRKCSRS